MPPLLQQQVLAVQAQQPLVQALALVQVQLQVPAELQVRCAAQTVKQPLPPLP